LYFKKAEDTSRAKNYDLLDVRDLSEEGDQFAPAKDHWQIKKAGLKLAC